MKRCTKGVAVGTDSMYVVHARHIRILSRRLAMPESAIPAYITSLIRHFEDLRDGTHGGFASRKDKEARPRRQLFSLLIRRRCPATLVLPYTRARPCIACYL